MATDTIKGVPEWLTAYHNSNSYREFEKWREKTYRRALWIQQHQILASWFACLLGLSLFPLRILWRVPTPLLKWVDRRKTEIRASSDPEAWRRKTIWSGGLAGMALLMGLMIVGVKR